MASERKADAVAADLLERIAGREIAVGSILPKEAELADHYGVARSVVREAIKLLEVHGLVRPTRRLGTVVLDPLASTSPEVVRALLVRKGRIDLDFFSGWLEVRAAIDAQMCELAATRRTPADIVALEAALAAMRGATARHDAFNVATEELALALARASHNPLFTVLARWHSRVVADLDHVFRTVRSASVPHVAGVEMMLECIRRGDAATTRQLVTTFHEWATPRLLAAARLANGEAPAELQASATNPSAAGPSAATPPTSKPSTSTPTKEKHA
ncbi:MAG: FadR family transcriptional regulator [Labilithrix sp.]|nr:FadR family transcriptional regulator [Labilithrix sp.]